MAAYLLILWFQPSPFASVFHYPPSIPPWVVHPSIDQRVFHPTFCCLPSLAAYLIFCCPVLLVSNILESVLLILAVMLNVVFSFPPSAQDVIACSWRWGTNISWKVRGPLQWTYVFALLLYLLIRTPFSGGKFLLTKAARGLFISLVITDHPLHMHRILKPRLRRIIYGTILHLPFLVLPPHVNSRSRPLAVGGYSPRIRGRVPVGL